MRAPIIVAILGSCGVCRGGLLTDFAASYALYQQCAMDGADFDSDLDIDGRDYLQWQRGLGSVGQFMNAYGDADRNGYVNQLDVNHWKGQFGGDLMGLPESVCFKLFLDPEGVIAGSATLVIDVPNPSPGTPRLVLGPETRIVDVHPQYIAQVVTQSVFSPSPGRQRLEVNVAFMTNDPTNPPAGPVTIFGLQTLDLMPQLGPAGVVTQIDFRPGDTVATFDSDTGITTTFDHTQLIDVNPSIAFPLTLDVNTVTGFIRLRNPASLPMEIPILTNYYEIASPTGTLSPNGWDSIDSTEGDPPGMGWEEAGGVSQFALSESNLTGVLELGNGQTRNLGQAYNVTRSSRDLRFLYATADGSLIPGEINYITSGPASPVPEPTGLYVAVVGFGVGASIARRQRQTSRCANWLST